MTDQEFSGFEPVDWEGNYKALKSSLEKAFKQAHSVTDPRDARDILIKAQAGFKDFRLRGADREELYRWLQDEFSRVNEKLAAEQSKFEQEAFYNYAELKMKVDEAIYQAGKCEDWREARRYLIDAQQGFKGLRLVREQREELYNKLQKAFDEVNLRAEQDNLNFQQESVVNYQRLKPLVEQAVTEAASGENFTLIRENLIKVQAEFKGIRLEKEKREILYQQLQTAFDTLNKRVEEAREKNNQIAEQNFEYFSQQVSEIVAEAAGGLNFKETRDRIRGIQAMLRDSLLLREQKDLLYGKLQESFTLINQRQDLERSTYENEAALNYNRLNKMVGDGLLQAQESNEFRETREFLKKIQGEFKGIRLVKEQREELYSRLQTAFGILRERTDTYFREKQKNWEVRMEFRLKDLSVHILELQMEVAKDKERLEELENQLEIVEQKSGDSPARLMVIAQIQSVQDTIRKNENMIESTSKEMEALQIRLGSDPEVTS